LVEPSKRKGNQAASERRYRKSERTTKTQLESRNFGWEGGEKEKDTKGKRRTSEGNEGRKSEKRGGPLFSGRKRPTSERKGSAAEKGKKAEARGDTRQESHQNRGLTKKICKGGEKPRRAKWRGQAWPSLGGGGETKAFLSGTTLERRVPGNIIRGREESRDKGSKARLTIGEKPSKTRKSLTWGGGKR